MYILAKAENMDAHFEKIYQKLYTIWAPFRHYDFTHISLII